MMAKLAVIRYYSYQVKSRWSDVEKTVQDELFSANVAYRNERIQHWIKVGNDLTKGRSVVATSARNEQSQQPAATNGTDEEL